MKYARLTKEQLEALEKEFINFLASQSITGMEWKQFKESKSYLAEYQLDVFSDLIWEGAIQAAEYLENSSTQQLFLFKLEKEQMRLIVIRVSNATVDLMTQTGLIWLANNIASNEAELFTASKKYSKDRNRDIFKLIQQGAQITKGELFTKFDALIT